jgi:hypothetical protein
MGGWSAGTAVASRTGLDDLDLDSGVAAELFSALRLMRIGF